MKHGLLNHRKMGWARLRGIILLLSSCLTANQGLASSVQGPGATSCAEFAKMFQADPSIENIFYTWAQGFWSAQNLIALSRKNPTRELARQQDNKRALRSFCAENPLKNYMDGVIQRYEHLPTTPNPE